MADLLETGYQTTEEQGSGPEILAPGSGEMPGGLTPAQKELRRMVLDSVTARAGYSAG